MKSLPDVTTAIAITPKRPGVIAVPYNAYQAGSSVQDSGPAQGDRAALSAFEFALAQLSDAATGLMAMYRCSESTSTRGYGLMLSPSDVTAAATGLLTSGARTVHAVIGRP